MRPAAVWWQAWGVLWLIAVSTARAGATDDADPFQQALAQLEAGDPAAARARVLPLARGHDPRAQELLAAMTLKGIGGPASVQQAMGWYCMLSHHPAGGRSTVKALWFLAEYHRTGGGVPGQGYLDGDPGRENPLKALFWFRVLERQEQYYQQVIAQGVQLGRIGAGIVERQLLEGEREEVEQRLRRWSATHTPDSPSSCLALP